MADFVLMWTDSGGDAQSVPFINGRVTFTKEANSNSAEFLFAKPDVTIDNDIIFKTGETFALYASDDLLDEDDLSVTDLIGTFVYAKEEIMPDDSMIKIICTDMTYNLLASLFTRDIRASESLGADDIVDKIIQESSQDGTSQETTSTNIATVRSDSTAFPAIDFVSLWKTSYDCITELSQTEYTGDTRPYIFWFDGDGVFNWVYPPDTLEDLELNYGETPVLSMKHSRDEVENINMIIYDAGLDLNDTPIIDFYFNPKADSIKGSIRYQPMISIAKEIKRNTAIVDNEEFITLAKLYAVAQAKRTIARVDTGTHKVVCDIPGQKVNMAKVHNVQSDMKLLDQLRLERVVHTFSRNGWQTRLELKEDDEYGE